MNSLLRPGDFVVLALGAALVGVLAWRALVPDAGDTLVVRARGELIAALPLARDRNLSIAGALGPARIEIRAGRARVAADPSPRQLCVKRGWLARAGDAALCLPNQISLEILGAGHDSLAY